MNPLNQPNFFNIKYSIPVRNDKKKEIEFHDCLTLLKSPKKIILNSSSYETFVRKNTPNKSSEVKYPIINTNESIKKTNVSGHISSKNSKQKLSKKIGVIPRPNRLFIKNNRRNNAIYYFNTINHDKCKSHDEINKHNNNHSYTFSKDNIPEIMSVRSFLDGISNVQNIMNQNAHYHHTIEKSEKELRDYIQGTINSFLTKKLITTEENSNLTNTAITKTIQISNKYKMELKLTSYSIYFKDVKNPSNNKTIVLPFKFIIYFLCCQKHINLIINIISYNDEAKEFVMDYSKLVLFFISQISVERLDFNYKKPISSSWIIKSEIYQFTIILPQMTFTLFESNKGNSQQLCYLTKLLESRIIVNLMKDNFSRWELLVLNSFSIFSSFRKEIFEIFSFKPRNGLRKCYSKFSINNNHSKYDLLKNQGQLNPEDESNIQNEQLSMHHWDFIITVNKITHCYTFYSFKIEVKNEGEKAKTLLLSLKQLRQILILSQQWNPYETIRRLLIVDDNSIPRLNLNSLTKVENIQEIPINHFSFLKIKRSASTNKKECIIKRKNEIGYSNSDDTNMKFKVIDPFFINENSLISVIPMDALVSMVKLHFREWPEFISKHYDILFCKQYDETPVFAKKEINSCKNLKSGLMKRRFHNN